MNMEQLRYFREICNCKSITKAAGALYVSPQALSKSVQNLEAALGVPLLKRSNRGVEPTAAGAILAERSSLLLAAYDTMLQDIQKQAGSELHEVKLGIVSCGLMNFPIVMYEPVLRRFPQHLLVIREAGDEEIEEALISGELAMALAGGPVHHKLLEKTFLTSFSYSLMVPESSPLSRKKSAVMSDLQGQSLVLLSGRYRARKAIDQELQLHMIQPSYVINVQQRDMILHLCRQGAGLSIVLTHPEQIQTLPGVHFLPIRDFTKTWDLFALRTRGTHSEAENVLYDYICRHPLLPAVGAAFGQFT